MELRVNLTILILMLTLCTPPGALAQGSGKAGCFEATFRAENVGQESGVNWVHQFELGPINPASVCVRANGSSVRFKYISKSLRVSGISPKDEVSIRYCSGQARCSDECPAPREDFFRAVAAEKSINPIPNAEAEETSFDGRVDALEESAKSGKIQYRLFKNWVRQGETPVCQSSKRGK